MASLEQSRQLVTEIPGPASLELNKRRAAAVSRGVNVSLPVFVARAGGGIVEDVDGNRLIDLGSGIAVTTIGNSSPRVVDAVRAQVADFTHTCFMVTPYEEYVAVAEELNRITPGSGEKRSVLFNSGAEAVENAIKVARSYTRKPAVVAFNHAYHGRTNLTMALTAKSMPYKSGFGPFAPEIYRAPLSYPYRDGLLDKELATDGEKAAARTIRRHRQADRRRQPGRRPHRADPGRGRIHRSGRGIPARPARLVPQERRGVHRRRGANRVRAHRRDVRLRARGHRARPDLHRQGHRRRAAAVGGDRPGRDHGRPACRRPGRHFRRQPGRLCGGAGHHRDHRERRPDRAGTADRTADRPSRCCGCRPPTTGSATFVAAAR